jgi:hypothetical protein
MNATTASNSAPNGAGRAAWICLVIAWLCFLIPIPGSGLFVGWPLNLAAFILAIVGMAKHGAPGGLFQLLASLIVSPLVYLFGWIFLLGGLSAMSTLENNGYADSAHEIDRAADASPREVDVNTLARAYRDDAAAADWLYKDAALRVSGRIASIGRDASDKPMLKLTDRGVGPVRAKNLSDEAVAGLSRGQSISLDCTGAGEESGEPVLEACSVSD